MTINVLLVDDHIVFAETLAVTLGTNADIEIVGVAHTAGDGRSKGTELRPDVALVDVNLPDYDGIELSKQLRSASPETRIIILTGNTEPSLFPRAMAAGACGFLFKDAGLSDVTDAIRRAYAGQVVVPDGLVERIAGAQAPAKGPGADLTKRELEILSMLAQGNDLRAIAKSLGITWNTARSYVKAILSKLDAHSQLEAVATATRLGIIGTRKE